MPADEPFDELRPGSFRVPDDARELARDVQALHRERRAQRRRARLQRVLMTRRWRAYGLSGPLVVSVLVVVAVFGALLTLLRPAAGLPVSSQPLASPSAAAGAVGGLLPDVAVRTPGGTVSARELARPGVLVLVPTPCGCAGVVREVVSEALQATRAVRLVSSGPQDPTMEQVARLRVQDHATSATVGVDERGTLAATYGAVGVTALFVGPDGVVVDVTRNIRPGQRLGAEVGALIASTRSH